MKRWPSLSNDSSLRSFHHDFYATELREVMGLGDRGYSPSEEARRKISERMKGNKYSKGWSYSTRESRKHRDPAIRRAAAQKSVATRRANGTLTGSKKRGYRHSPEAIERMRVAQSGRRPISEEARERMRVSHLGNKNRLGKFCQPKSHCPKGHEYTPDNTIRVHCCRTCINETKKIWTREDRARRRVMAD